MARMTHDQKDRLIETLRARIAHLETRAAVAESAPAFALENPKPCARCAGTGRYDNGHGIDGPCFRCRGDGIDPGKEQGQREFAIRSITRLLSGASHVSVQRPRTSSVQGMSEERRAFFAAHPDARSATPSQIRAWWNEINACAERIEM